MALTAPSTETLTMPRLSASAEYSATPVPVKASVAVSPAVFEKDSVPNRSPLV